jgi:flavin reductase (NADH)
MSSFPTGVSIVTAMDRHGHPRGATCSSLASVTLSPPTLLVCLREHGGTLLAVLGGGGVGVEVPSHLGG